MNSWIKGDGKQDFEGVVLADRRWEYQTRKPLFRKRGMYHGTLGKVSVELSGFAALLELSGLESHQKQAIYDTFVELCDQYEFLMLDYDETVGKDGGFRFRSILTNERFTVHPDGSWERMAESTTTDTGSD